jgi:two-component system, cell cycle sensor histidine kinase and response regulator CckA
MSHPKPAPRSILIVEDHDNVRQELVRALRDDGYHVMEALDGELALSVLASGIHIDLLVTDVVMPHMGGLELAAILDAMRHRPHLLFMSAYAFEPSSMRGPLLRKPFRPSDLVAEVRRLLTAA